MTERTTRSATTSRPAKRQKTKSNSDVSGKKSSSSAKTSTTASPPPLNERIASLLPILEAHDVSPADLLLAVVKAERGEPANAAMKKYRADLYDEPRNSWSKLSDILEGVTESKKGLKALKSWLRSDSAEEIITGIIQQEIHGEGSEEEEEEE